VGSDQGSARAGKTKTETNQREYIIKLTDAQYETQKKILAMVGIPIERFARPNSANESFEIPEAWRGDPIGIAYYRGKAAGKTEAARSTALALLDELESEIQGVTDSLFGILPVTDSVNKNGLKKWIQRKREALEQGKS
jgi:hypothetical protein